MPIDGGMRDKLEPGTVLVAKYKGAEHRAEVITGDEGRTLYRLDDGREFKSPSSAASAVMGGIAANGWRFWSLAAEVPATDARSTPATKTRGGRKPKAAVEPVEPAEIEGSIQEPAAE
jgi:hypothetical protein